MQQGPASCDALLPKDMRWMVAATEAKTPSIRPLLNKRANLSIQKSSRRWKWGGNVPNRGCLLWGILRCSTDGAAGLPIIVTQREAAQRVNQANVTWRGEGSELNLTHWSPEGFHSRKGSLKHNTKINMIETRSEKRRSSRRNYFLINSVWLAFLLCSIEEINALILAAIKP